MRPSSYSDDKPTQERKTITINKLEIGVPRRQRERVSRDCGKPSGIFDFLSRSRVPSKTT